MAKSGFAIASLVCGILGFLLPVVNILAIVFGIIALNKIKNNPDLEGRTMAIIGIVLGILGWVINVILILIIIGSFAYFGVLDSDSMIPEKCSVPLMFNCKDFLVTDNSISLSIQNGAGRILLVLTIAGPTTKRLAAMWMESFFPKNLH